jgi:hypothetical protein
VENGEVSPEKPTKGGATESENKRSSSTGGSETGSAKTGSNTPAYRCTNQYVRVLTMFDTHFKDSLAVIDGIGREENSARPVQDQLAFKSVVRRFLENAKRIVSKEASGLHRNHGTGRKFFDCLPVTLLRLSVRRQQQESPCTSYDSCLLHNNRMLAAASQRLL